MHLLSQKSISQNTLNMPNTKMFLDINITIVLEDIQYGWNVYMLCRAMQSRQIRSSASDTSRIDHHAFAMVRLKLWVNCDKNFNFRHLSFQAVERNQIFPRSLPKNSHYLKTAYENFKIVREYLASILFPWLNFIPDIALIILFSTMWLYLNVAVLQIHFESKQKCTIGVCTDRRSEKKLYV